MGLVLLRPVLLSPVTADDVYHSMFSAVDPDRTIGTDIAELPQTWRTRLDIGRVNVLTAVERRNAGRAVVEAAVATGRPVNQVLGVFKIWYAALSLFAVYALLRAIRWRRADSGFLVRMESGTRTIAMVAGGLAFAAGAQAQHTGGTGGHGGEGAQRLARLPRVDVDRGILHLRGGGTDAVARAPGRGPGLGRRRACRPAPDPIGVASNFRYELTFPALPLTLLALVLLPVSDLENRAAGRRAKWLLGSAYGIGFGAVLVVNRMLVSDVCGSGDCYSGVSLSLGPTMFRTFAINVASSIPGTGTPPPSRSPPTASGHRPSGRS